MDLDQPSQRSTYADLMRRRVLVIVGLSLFLVVGSLYAISLGVVSISLRDTYGILSSVALRRQHEYPALFTGIIMDLRLPRVLLTVTTGSALGVTGALMQSVLRNPLASPFTLGVSSGASFGAALAIVLGTWSLGIHVADSAWVTISGAFIFGLLTILLINGLASISGGGASMLILAGVALGYLFSAGVSFLKYVTDHEQLRELTVWLMGGLYRANWTSIMILVPVVSLGILYLLRLAWDINALAAGEETAASLGVNVQRLRRNGSVAAALLTSCVISFTGIIGFVGLIAPHLTRMLVGNDNRLLLLSSGLVGAIMLLVADTIARLIIDPAELPVGIITSLIGAPFFLYLLVKKRRTYWT